MKLLNDYFKKEKEVHDYFGYVEDWKAIPMDDCRQYYWKLYQKAEDTGGKVRYAKTIEGLRDDEGANTYEDSIYTQRFLPKFTYRGKDFTMVSCDPHVDLNHFLRIFSNDKEVK